MGFWVQKRLQVRTLTGNNNIAGNAESESGHPLAPTSFKKSSHASDQELFDSFREAQHRMARWGTEIRSRARLRLGMIKRQLFQLANHFIPRYEVSMSAQLPASDWTRKDVPSIHAMTNTGWTCIITHITSEG